MTECEKSGKRSSDKEQAASRSVVYKSANRRSGRASYRDARDQEDHDEGEAEEAEEEGAAAHHRGQRCCYFRARQISTGHGAPRALRLTWPRLALSSAASPRS